MSYHGYKDAETRKAYLRKKNREYRARKKEKGKQLIKESVVLQKPTEKNLTELIKDANGDFEKLLIIYDKILSEEAEILRIPGVIGSPYYLWVQSEREIRQALSDDWLKRVKQVLGEKHVEEG